MGILQFSARGTDYLWGGTRLAREYGKEMTGEVLAETWELSCRPGMESVVRGGIYEGLTLPEALRRMGGDPVGARAAGSKDFPLLIKLIDAAKDLSVQVHPDDAYARAHENSRGKTEMWVVLDAEKEAGIYCGFRRPVTRDEVRESILDGTLTDLLARIPVKKGDVIFLPAGTVHALGKGTLVAEVQQNSDVTYRLYDYGRVGADGKPRALHIEQALEVASLKPVRTSRFADGHLASCDYFTVDAIYLEAGEVLTDSAGADSFVHLLILEGEGAIAAEGEELPFLKGDSFFIPAGSGGFSVRGPVHALRTTL